METEQKPRFLGRYIVAIPELPWQPTLRHTGVGR